MLGRCAAREIQHGVGGLSRASDQGEFGRLGLALGVRGLMNVQYAIKDDVVYVLEVNPRASRTVPFVAKATDSAIASIAAGGTPPSPTSANGEFFDTGVKLCTDMPMDTVTSAEQWTAQQCIDNAWG